MTEHDGLIISYTHCDRHAKYEGYCLDCKDASLIDSMHQLYARNAELQAVVDRLVKENYLFRRSFALARTPKSGLYLDDGEIQDNQLPYPIDYKNDSHEDIQKYLLARYVEKHSGGGNE